MFRVMLPAALTLWAIAPAWGAVLAVGPGQTFATLAAAQQEAQPGDTLRLSPGVHRDCLTVRKDGLIIEGSGAAEITELAGFACDGKAALVTQAANITVRNLTLSHQRVADGNGAGIRAEGTDLLVDHVRIIDNQDGILAASNPGSTITVRDSDFIDNGTCNPACAHGIYVGHIKLLHIAHSRFFETWRAHHIKSRAQRTEIVDCDIADGPRGTASYAIEIPNGGMVLLRGNRIEKGPQSENHAGFIAIGAEGSLYPDTEIIAQDNVAVFDGVYPTSFLRNLTDSPALLRGNLIPDGVVPLKGGGDISPASQADTADAKR